VAFHPLHDRQLCLQLSRFLTAENLKSTTTFLTRGTDKIVRTRLIPAHDTPVELALSDARGERNLEDCRPSYSDGISELTLRRSDFRRSARRWRGSRPDSPSEPVQRPSHEVVSAVSFFTLAGPISGRLEEQCRGERPRPERSSAACPCWLFQDGSRPRGSRSRVRGRGAR